MRLSLRAHPMGTAAPCHRRADSEWINCQKVALRRLSVCGLVITRQRPGTASGVVFLTLEDETGVCNVVVWPKIYDRFRRAVMGGRLVRVRGTLQREGIVTHLIAEQIEDLSHRLADLGHPMDDAIGITQPQADDAPRAARPQVSARHPPEQAKKLFPSRDFTERPSAPHIAMTPHIQSFQGHGDPSDRRRP